MAEQRPETLFDDPKLALYAEKQDGMEKRPTLRPSFYENNPRLVVKTQIPNDRNNGRIDANMDNHAFYSLMEMIRMVATSREPTVAAMDNWGHPFIDKKRSPEPRPMSRTIVEKDAQGVISICISAGKNRPVIKFPFLNSTYHHFLDGEGNQMPIGVASRLFALGWVSMMERYMAQIVADHYKKPEWMTRNDNNNGGGGNGGYNNNRNGGGGYNGGNRGGNGGGYNNGGYNSNNGNRNGGGSTSSGGSSDSNYSFDDDIPL